jgi:hypothetical protein
LLKQGVAVKTEPIFGTGALNVTVDGTSAWIDITATNNSLEGIMKAINEADLGVKAAIINDGSGSPGRPLSAGPDWGECRQNLLPRQQRTDRRLDTWNATAAAPSLSAGTGGFPGPYPGRYHPDHSSSNTLK